MSSTESLATAADGADIAIKNSIEYWAESTTLVETYERHHKLNDKISVVTNFFAFTKKHPADIKMADVRGWREELERRGQKPATVYARVSRVSSFYKWLMADPQLGRFIHGNPAAGARPRHPQPYQSEATKSLTDDEMNRLIAVVKKKADEGSVVAKRDYALLLFFFLTGLRRTEVINFRGRDLSYEDGRLVIGYRRKGGKFVGREVGDTTPYNALLEYLEATNRQNVLGSERPLWTRHDRAGKPGAPLSSRSFADNLKKYADAAGMSHIHVHQTRHTYARIIAEETGSYIETQEALDHENPATTRVYVQRITVKADKHSRKIADRMNRSKSGATTQAGTPPEGEV
jgi:integrase